MTGAELIAAERIRQVKEEGFSVAHDEQHDDGELVAAAVCYAFPEELAKEWWPWDFRGFKPTPDDRIGELSKAGALVAAEIDRLQRLES